MRATASTHLRQLPREDHRYVFTLIHKFLTERGDAHPVVSDRDDVIVPTDETHRTQHDTLARNMRNALKSSPTDPKRCATSRNCVTGAPAGAARSAT
ncbi:MAG: hypothetical protein ACLPQS_17610 [Acidimicrobiales bacterium]